MSEETQSPADVPKPMQQAWDLLYRLDGMRGSYFLQWLLKRWAANTAAGLQDESVAQLVREYDREKKGASAGGEKSVNEEGVPS